jgi:hypothetical protein
MMRSRRLLTSTDVLSGVPGDGIVIVTAGALGFLDAAADDRRRWAMGFRALLDGLDSFVQVLIDSRTSGADSGGRLEVSDRPEPGRRRWHDLAFADSLRDTEGAQSREVRFVTAPSGADRLTRALTDMGVPDIRLAPLKFGDHATRPHLERPWAVRDGEGWHRTWCVERFPGGELEPGWLRRLLVPGLHVTLGWHAERLPTSWVVEYLGRQLLHLRATQMHQSEDVEDPRVEGAVPAAHDLRQDLVASREQAFHVSLYLTLTASNEAELAGAAERIESAGRASLCTLMPCDFRQRDGRVATLPLGRDPLARRRMLQTSAVATLFPWFDADLQQPRGVVVGSSRATGQPVLLDPFDDRTFANANIGVFGHSGAGKTYLLSTLAMGALGLGTQVFVIDPEHEYGRLATELGGLDVQLRLGGECALNVLDIGRRHRDRAELGSAAADAVDLCATICGGLDETERADLEAAATRAFEAVPDPLLADVARALPPDARVARILGRWVNGGLGGIFSRPTNIDLDAPIVVFGMRELRAEMVEPVHYLLAEALWARIKDRDRRRLLVIDELGLLFENPTIRRFVVTLARRIRKYDGALVFATQNPGDLLASEAGAVVATNPAIHFFGAMRPGEAAKLQRAFQLSDVQRAGLEAARRGDFLLAAGAERIPVRVKAPPWQAATMGRARSPPGQDRHGAAQVFESIGVRLGSWPGSSITVFMGCPRIGSAGSGRSLNGSPMAVPGAETSPGWQPTSPMACSRWSTCGTSASPRGTTSGPPVSSRRAATR